MSFQVARCRIQIEIRHPILLANQEREALDLGVVEIFYQSLVGEGGGQLLREVVGVPLGGGRDGDLAFSALRGVEGGLQLGGGLEMGGWFRPLSGGTRQARGVEGP